jgi:hypothetical protein
MKGVAIGEVITPASYPRSSCICWRPMRITGRPGCIGASELVVGEDVGESGDEKVVNGQLEGASSSEGRSNCGSTLSTEPVARTAEDSARWSG